MAETVLNVKPIEEVIEGYDPASAEHQDEYGEWVEAQVRNALLADGGIIRVVYPGGASDRVRLDALGDIESVGTVEDGGAEPDPEEG